MSIMSNFLIKNDTKDISIGFSIKIWRSLMYFNFFQFFLFFSKIHFKVMQLCIFWFLMENGRFCSFWWFWARKRGFTHMVKIAKSFHFWCLTTSQNFFFEKSVVFEKIGFFDFFFARKCWFFLISIIFGRF